jgi:hypothetical protein
VSEHAGDGRARYRAFISYSHRDAAFGRRLHRRLERYRPPRKLAGPAHTLVPIFRDREELAAAHDLTAEVRAALAASASLIVVCSPAAAASKWVALEIELFRSLHPDRPILAALIDGDPAQAFPPQLQQGGAEPLAADFRSSGDGERLALLKLVAGVLGVGLDQLVQRDAQRRLQRVTAVTVAAFAAMLAMGVLTGFALDARSQAERQRAQAEGLVEFMLTDLRERLKGVGRLDVMTAVNRRALAYYAAQDLSRLPPDSLERWAHLLHEMGEDDEALGNYAAARKEFAEAARTTAALLDQAPDDPERIYDHAQSEFWLGFADFDHGRPAAARPAFVEYKRLADRLTALRPDNPKYLREAAFAEGNLCSMALTDPRDPPEAVRACTAALAHMQDAARRMPPSGEMQLSLINRHAWLADAFSANDQPDRARAERLTEEALLTGELAKDPKNVRLQLDWITTQRALARLDARAGRMPPARERLERARAALDRMIAFDASHHDWAELRQHIDRDLADVQSGKRRLAHD